MQQASKWPRYIPPGVVTSLIAFTSTGWTNTATTTSYNTYFIPSPSLTGTTSYSPPPAYTPPATSSLPPTYSPPSPSTSAFPRPSTYISISTATAPSLLPTRVVSATDSASVTSSLTTNTTLIATLIASGSRSQFSSRLIALIVGITCGLIALILGALIAYRRHKRRTGPRTEDEGLLEEGAEIHDVNGDNGDTMDDIQTTMRSLHTSARGPSAVSITALRRPGSPTPSLLKNRVSETGSIFQEDVWPPPTSPGMIDPIRMSSSQVDLGTIVDDVMGPVPSASNAAAPLHDHGHRRELSSDSSMPLLGFRHFSGSFDDYPQSPPSPASSVSIALPASFYADFVIDTGAQALSESYTRPTTSSSPTLPTSADTPLSPLLLPLSHHRPSSSSSTAPSISSSVGQLNRTQPKVSSPLARAFSGFGSPTPDSTSDPSSSAQSTSKDY